jgi:hypothetical protein
MMELHNSERTQMRRPVAPPVTLDDGRLDVGRAVALAGFVFGALLLGALGAWAGVAQLDGGSGAVGALGAAVALLAWGFGGTVGTLGALEWLDRRRRVEDWHNAALVAYEEAQGAETVEQVSEYTLTTSNPAHVLLAALWTHMRLREGVETPYSARKLTGPGFLAGRRAFEVSKLGGEEMSRRFAELGLVQGRADGRAGEWVPETAEEVWDTVLRRWR